MNHSTIDLGIPKTGPRLEFDQLRRIYFEQRKTDEAGLRMDLLRRKADKESLKVVRSHLVYLLKSKPTEQRQR